MGSLTDSDKHFCRRHYLKTAFLLGALLISGGARPAFAEESFALVGGTLIDGLGGTPVENAVVLVEGNKITAVGSASLTNIPTSARLINVAGLTILPGLVDSHMHIGGSGAGSADPREFTATAMENSLLSYLKFGVTSVYDMAAHPGLNDMKAALDAGDIIGPRLYGNGFGITAPGSHPIRLITELGLLDFLGPYYFQVDSVGDARKAVRQIVKSKTDGIKIFHSRAESGTTRVDADRNKLQPDILKAVIDAAHAQGQKVYAHISYPSEAKEFVEAGGNVVVHSIHMAETGADEVLKLMAARDVVYIPTLSVFEGNYIVNPDLFFMSRLRGKVWDVFLDSITDEKSVVLSRQLIPGLGHDAKRSLDISMANLRTAVKAGVKITLGSDAGNAGMLHGATVMRELQLMHQAGMTPMQIIVAATKNGAEVIGQGKTLGTLEAGKLADIIVVKGNPLTDISDIGNVEWLVKNGKLLDPNKLQFKDVPVPTQSK
ncbi:MAG: imidazolonepropionase-like amidohydrolase [Planctomycetota bacterium]